MALLVIHCNVFHLKEAHATHNFPIEQQRTQEPGVIDTALPSFPAVTLAAEMRVVVTSQQFTLPLYHCK